MQATRTTYVANSINTSNMRTASPTIQELVMVLQTFKQPATSEQVAHRLRKSAGVATILLNKARKLGLVDRISAQPNTSQQQRRNTRRQASPPPPPQQQPDTSKKEQPLQVANCAYDMVPVLMLAIEKFIRQLTREKLVNPSANIDTLRKRYMKLRERVIHLDSGGGRAAESPEEWTACWMALTALFEITVTLRKES